MGLGPDMRIALIQQHATSDLAGNLSRAMAATRRAAGQGANLVMLLPIPEQQGNSSAGLALNRAQGESTFASVRLL